MNEEYDPTVVFAFFVGWLLLLLVGWGLRELGDDLEMRKANKDIEQRRQDA